MYFYLSRNNCDWRLRFVAIAALAVSLTGCVTEERSTVISRKSEVALAPVPPCTEQELRTALAAKRSGYDYRLRCS